MMWSRDMLFIGGGENVFFVKSASDVIQFALLHLTTHLCRHKVTAALDENVTHSYALLSDFS